MSISSLRPYKLPSRLACKDHIKNSSTHKSKLNINCKIIYLVSLFFLRHSALDKKYIYSQTRACLYVCVCEFFYLPYVVITYQITFSTPFLLIFFFGTNFYFYFYFYFQCALGLMNPRDDSASPCFVVYYFFSSSLLQCLLF